MALAEEHHSVFHFGKALGHTLGTSSPRGHEFRGDPREALHGATMQENTCKPGRCRCSPESIMAPERAPPLQDTFLKHVQEHGVPVTVFLMNGIRLQGYITHFDNYGVALTRD